MLLSAKTKFLSGLENNQLLKTIASENSVSSLDLSKYDYIKEWEDEYIFENVRIEDIIFSEIFVSCLHRGLWFYLTTRDRGLKLNPELYFGWKGTSLEKKWQTSKEVQFFLVRNV